MNSITSALVKYNANSRNNSVGDCVKRSLSVAYSMDYDAVSTELNRIKRNLGCDEFNEPRVFNLFMKLRGDAFNSVHPNNYVTVEEFGETHPNGVYLLLAGKNPNNRDTTHMIAVVNGDIYDSWNSLEYYVKNYATVSTGRSEVYEADWKAVAADVANSVYTYVMNTLKPKQLDCMDVECESIARYGGNVHTYKIYMTCKLGDVPRSSKYWSNRTYGNFIILKMNPRLSEEENTQSLTKKCKQKAYDWLYNIKDDITKSAKAEAIEARSGFYGDKKLLIQCPEWARPLITFAHDRGSVMSQESYNYWPRYEINMVPLPDDPRTDRYNNAVTFEADSLKDLRNQFEMYKEDFSRPGWDY